MNLNDAAFLADENVHSDVGAYLRSHGNDVVEVNGSDL